MVKIEGGTFSENEMLLLNLIRETFVCAAALVALERQDERARRAKAAGKPKPKQESIDDVRDRWEKEFVTMLQKFAPTLTVRLSHVH